MIYACKYLHLAHGVLPNSCWHLFDHNPRPIAKTASKESDHSTYTRWTNRIPAEGLAPHMRVADFATVSLPILLVGFL